MSINCYKHVTAHAHTYLADAAVIAADMVMATGVALPFAGAATRSALPAAKAVDADVGLRDTVTASCGAPSAHQRERKNMRAIKSSTFQSFRAVPSLILARTSSRALSVSASPQFRLTSDIYQVPRMRKC